MMTVLNKKNVDTTTQPLFLGEPLGLQRYDRFKYPIFWELYNKQIEFFWRPEEIELKKDRADFQTLTDNEKFIFTSNLKYQTMLFLHYLNM
jgi:ribonucleoside-diphosphate reductase beta chain